MGGTDATLNGNSVFRAGKLWHLREEEKVRVMLNYHLGTEIGGAENIFFTQESKQETSSTDVSRLATYGRKPTLRHNRFVSLPRSKKIF